MVRASFVSPIRVGGRPVSLLLRLTFKVSGSGTGTVPDVGLPYETLCGKRAFPFFFLSSRQCLTNVMSAHFGLLFVLRWLITPFQHDYSNLSIFPPQITNSRIPHFSFSHFGGSKTVLADLGARGGEIIHRQKRAWGGRLPLGEASWGKRGEQR